MSEFARRAMTILAQDRVWAAYAIADLQPAFAPACVWSLCDGAAGAAAALLYYGLPTPILFTSGDADALTAALDEWAVAGALPAQVDLSIRAEHAAAVYRHFEPPAAAKPMLRMWLADAQRVPAPTAGVVRLAAADAPRLQHLYAGGGPFAPDAFVPDQLTDGVFYGVTAADGSLLAAGGTHLLHPGERIAAIGNMYTQPAHRGCGLAALVLAAVVHTLLADGFATIVLNVDSRNDVARRLYARFGFAIHCPFTEGVAVKQGIGNGA